MPLGPQTQTLFEELPPLRAGNPIFCHQEFLEKMEENRCNTVGRRAALLLHRLLVNLNRQYYKPTQGQNRGWRRSPLGGSHGSHFYAWWAPRGAAPLKESPEFDAAPEGSIFLREIRHHDDHRPLNPQSLSENYLPVDVKDLRRADYVPDPWTDNQTRFAKARQKIRIVKGFPGSGKTTALWHAADVAGRERVLYLTYSPELATLAREHFDKFVPGQVKVRVVTYAQFLRELLVSDMPYQAVPQTRAAFVKAISGFSTSILGPWLNDKGALYDEIHAHLIGAALPFRAGRFSAVPDRRFTARQYRELRERSLGRAAAEAVVEITETLRKRSASAWEPQFFPELDLAWQAVQHIRANGAGPFAGFDCVAIDEAQDLTPIEAVTLVELVDKLNKPVLLVAGDEAQTVRPTDFEWGWFQDFIHDKLGMPVETRLQTNLRSPRRIALLVNRVWDLYGAIAKRERPGGAGVADFDANAGDQLVYCVARPGPELEQLLEALTAREGLAVIVLGDEVPGYVPAHLRERILTTFEAKGLDFQSVCVLDAGRAIERISHSRERGRGLEVEDLSKRLAIDQLRVAFSRPAERLYWLEVAPTDRAREAADTMLSLDEQPYPLVPAGLLKCLEEEALDVEERVRLCESDARQLLEARPVLARSRAQQAVSLLGEEGSKFSVSDPEARKSAFMTLCEVSVHLGLRRVGLPPELGVVDFFNEAAYAADRASRPGLSHLVAAIGRLVQNYGEDKPSAIRMLSTAMQRGHEDLDPWLITELQPYSREWISLLEEDIATVPTLVYEELPIFYVTFQPDDAEKRIGRLRDAAIDAYLAMRDYPRALHLLNQSEEPNPKLIAACHEGMGQLELAASEFLEAGRTADALRCYRRIPDFDRTLALLQNVKDHPARESLEWLRRMRDLAAERPPEFSKQVLPEEKKLLEELLESSLGTVRKKPAAKKPVVKKAAAPKAAKPKAAPKKKAPAPRKPPKEWF